MVPWRGRECVQQRRLFRWGRSAKACWTHNDIENKQWWMGTWSPRNHRTLNGKSLSSGAQPSSSTTGRPRRQGVKVHRLCVSVCVRTAYDTHRRLAAHICTNTWREDADTVKKVHINIQIHAFTLPPCLTYTLTHRGEGGRLPNQPPATILFCHSLSPAWLMKTREGLTAAARSAPHPNSSCGITTCGQRSC